MHKVPRIFIRKVFTGKVPVSLIGINPIKYLSIEPKNPPKPTINNLV